MSDSTPPIPETYALTGAVREERTRQAYVGVVRAWVQTELQAAGVDYRSHYHDYGGTSRELYAGALHLRLLDLSLLAAADPHVPPAPLALPLHSGAGHTTWWTRAAQRDVAAVASRIYREAVQAVDHIWEDIERSVAVMLDTARGMGERNNAAWATVRRLHTPPSDTVRRASLVAAVAAVRAHTLPPETDLAAYRGVHADRLRAAGEARLRWLCGPARRAVGSAERAAYELVETRVREGELRIGRAVDAAAVRTEYAAVLALVAGVALGTGPGWRLLAGPGARRQRLLPAGAAYIAEAVARSTPPYRAAVLEAWSPPATPGDPETAGVTLVEAARSSDPAALRARIVRGATLGVDRVELDWLVAAPRAPVHVDVTARSVLGPSEVTLTVPAPRAPAAPAEPPA